jgi:hypothetical protein
MSCKKKQSSTIELRIADADIDKPVPTGYHNIASRLFGFTLTDLEQEMKTQEDEFFEKFHLVRYYRASSSQWNVSSKCLVLSRTEQYVDMKSGPASIRIALQGL